MDIIEKNEFNFIYCNISNEVVNSYYTLVIEAPEYAVSATLDPPTEVNGRYVSFEVIEGAEDLPRNTIELPNYGDYPYKIMNATTEGGTDGVEIHRGILRYQQPQEDTTSYTDEETTVIYE